MYSYCVRKDNGALGFTVPCDRNVEKYEDLSVDDGCTYVSKGVETVKFKNAVAVVSDQIYGNRESSAEWDVGKLAVGSPDTACDGQICFRQAVGRDGYTFARRIRISVRGYPRRTQKVQKPHELHQGHDQDGFGMQHTYDDHSIYHVGTFCRTVYQSGLDYGGRFTSTQYSHFFWPGSGVKMASDLVLNSRKYRFNKQSYIGHAVDSRDVQVVRYDKLRTLVQGRFTDSAANNLAVREMYMVSYLGDEGGAYKYILFVCLRDGGLEVVTDVEPSKSSPVVQFLRWDATTEVAMKVGVRVQTEHDITLQTRPGGRYIAVTHGEDIAVQVLATDARPLAIYIL